MLFRRSLLAGPLAAALFALGPSGVSSQGTTPLFGVGYTANAPRLLAGGSAWAVFPSLRGFGLYVDAKFSTDSPAGTGDEYLAGVTAEQMEADFPAHLFHVSEDAYRSFNAAVAYMVSRELIAYAGGGWVERTHYRQYYDETEEFGRFGFYWVDDPRYDTSGPNLLAGVLFRLGANVRAQFGAETRPFGFTAGLALNFPGL